MDCTTANYDYNSQSQVEAAESALCERTSRRTGQATQWAGQHQCFVRSFRRPMRVLCASERLTERRRSRPKYPCAGVLQFAKHHNIRTSALVLLHPLRPPEAATDKRNAPGGSDCVSLSAFSVSVTQSVYRYLEQRILNLTTLSVFLILTERASFRRAFWRKSRMSVICFGCKSPHEQHIQRQSTAPPSSTHCASGGEARRCAVWQGHAVWQRARPVVAVLSNGWTGSNHPRLVAIKHRHWRRPPLRRCCQPVAGARVSLHALPVLRALVGATAISPPRRQRAAEKKTLRSPCCVGLLNVTKGGPCKARLEIARAAYKPAITRLWLAQNPHSRAAVFTTVLAHS